MLSPAEFQIPLDNWRQTALAVLMGAALGAALVLGTLAFRNRTRGPVRRLLGRLATEKSIGVILRGMFVPNAEFYSRDPDPGGGETPPVRKWTGVPEVYDACHTRAGLEVLGLLSGLGAGQIIWLRSAEAVGKAWGDDAIAVGDHFKTQQILESCEPRLVAYRYPDAFRSLASRDVFEAKDGADFGLIYKGFLPPTRKTFLALMGLGPAGTEAAARFLRTQATALGHVTGGGAFAAIVDPRPGREPILRWLHPRPNWWRRLVYRKALQRLAGTPKV
jgi:hypothetical protein